MTALPAYALIYTSFDDGQSRGGWGVKSERAGAAAGPGDREALLAGVRTDLAPVAEVPQFPTISDRQDFTRRLEHRSLAEARSGIWHAIPAGVDGSGRPGNIVITACLMAAAAAQESPAISYWRSPSFATPFGAPEVVQAELPEVPILEPGPLADLGSVVHFLFPFPRPPRVARFCAILDATWNAVEIPGTPGIALMVGDCDEAALWIAAICAFAPPSWAARLSWSTFERARSLGDPAVKSLHIVAVPRADRALVDKQPHGRLVIDPELDLAARTYAPNWVDELEANAWSLNSGANVKETEWSRQVREQCEQGDDALLPVLQRLRGLVGWPGSDPAGILALLAERPTTEHPDLTYVTMVLDSDLLSGDMPVRSRRVDPTLHVPVAQQKVDAITKALRAGRQPHGPLVEQGKRVLDFLTGCGVAVDASELRDAIVAAGAAKSRAADARVVAQPVSQVAVSPEAQLSRHQQVRPGDGVKGRAESPPGPRAEILAHIAPFLDRTDMWEDFTLGDASRISREAARILKHYYFLPSDLPFLRSSVLTTDARTRLELAILAVHASGGRYRWLRTQGECQLLLAAAGEILGNENWHSDARLLALVAFYSWHVICAQDDLGINSGDDLLRRTAYEVLGSPWPKAPGFTAEYRPHWGGPRPQHLAQLDAQGG